MVEVTEIVYGRLHYQVRFNEGRVLFDLLNEPDAFGMKWSSWATNTKGKSLDSYKVPPWAELYLSTASVLAAHDPVLLFLCEGTGQFDQPGTCHGRPLSTHEDDESAGIIWLIFLHIFNFNSLPEISQHTVSVQKTEESLNAADISSRLLAYV